MLIVAMSLPSFFRVFPSVLFVRFSSIILLFAGAFFYVIYIQSIGSGIGLYSGLFIFSIFSCLLDTFFIVGHLLFLIINYLYELPLLFEQFGLLLSLSGIVVPTNNNNRLFYFRSINYSSVPFLFTHNQRFLISVSGSLNYIHYNYIAFSSLSLSPTLNSSRSFSSSSICSTDNFWFLFSRLLNNKYSFKDNIDQTKRKSQNEHQSKQTKNNNKQTKTIKQKTNKIN